MTPIENLIKAYKEALKEIVILKIEIQILKGEIHVKETEEDRQKPERTSVEDGSSNDSSR